MPDLIPQSTKVMEPALPYLAILDSVLSYLLNTRVNSGKMAVNGFVIFQNFLHNHLLLINITLNIIFNSLSKIFNVFFFDQQDFCNFRQNYLNISIFL
jgi:hypothetical protein